MVMKAKQDQAMRILDLNIDGTYGLEQIMIADIDRQYRAYEKADYWKYVLPRFITFDWRVELKVWMTGISSTQTKSP